MHILTDGLLAPSASMRWVMPLFLLGLVFLPHAMGTTPEAGVKVGDYASYVVSIQVSGNSTLVKTFVDSYRSYENTSYVNLNVTAVVAGTNVSLTQEIHHTNGAIVRGYSTVDVNLAVENDYTPVLIMQNYPPTLTSISNGTFFRVSRTVNNFILSSSGNVSRYSWDEETGMLLSEHLLYTVDANATNTGTFTYAFVMFATNLWHYVPPTPPPNTISPTGPYGLGFAELYALVGVIGSLAVGIAAYAIKRSPKARGRSRLGARDSRRSDRESNREKSANNR